MPVCPRILTILPKAEVKKMPAEKRVCWECGGTFTYAQCKANDGDWSDNYCGC